ncbi:MAG: hypothetical protein OXD33_03250 [Rhodobacteraceae bacterium]|nr:hypothetical protein [Paracoccaceae bacterium]
MAARETRLILAMAGMIGLAVAGMIGLAVGPPLIIGTHTTRGPMRSMGRRTAPCLAVTAQGHYP